MKELAIATIALTLAALPPLERDAFVASLTPQEALVLKYDWSFWARPSQQPPQGDWSTWLALAGRGWGKALALDTQIPTPDGWTRMGDLQVGDQVFSEEGRQCRVTMATPIQFGRDCYRLRFSDGTTIVADADHRWVTWDKAARKAAGRAANPVKRPMIRTTAEIAATLTVDEGERNHAVVLCSPLQLPPRQLLVDPYVLGVWLGDGDSRDGIFTTADHEMVALLEERGCSVSEPRPDARSRAVRYALSKCAPRRDAATGRMVGNDSLVSRLKSLGVIHNKHVPVAYLRASEDQRRALLAGLMDTDGSVAAGGHVEFCVTSAALAHGVVELARSLGFKPVIAESRARLSGRDCGPRYRVRWTPHVPVFRLSRKLGRQRTVTSQAQRNQRRYIVEVERVESVPVRCITVDAPSHLYLAGDGMIPTHNTRVGAELVHTWARELGKGGRIALVGKDPGDIRKTMIEGESGLLACAAPWARPFFEPTKRTITWPNGCQAFTYSAEVPDDLRGPQHHKFWGDESCKWKRPQETWDNLQMGLRLGANPQGVVTTTPRPMPTLREILKDPTTIVTRGSMFENAANLPKRFLDRMLAKYEGTRLGRQELSAELLEDTPGALWTLAMLESNRVKPEDVPHLVRIVVSIDPAATSAEDADETGIIVAGLGVDGHGYVLDDRSDHYTPAEWAKAAVLAYKQQGADRIVAEVNNGGEMVEHTIRTVDKAVSYKAVHASRGKRTRAEPVSALYEQNRVHHVGMLAELEDQQITWVPNEGDSPDRVDALVWALTELMIGGPVTVRIS